METCKSEYEESAELQNQLLSIMNEISEIKKTDCMANNEKLEKINANYKKELAKLEEKQQEIFRTLEERHDVSDQVILDF